MPKSYELLYQLLHRRFLGGKICYDLEKFKGGLLQMKKAKNLFKKYAYSIATLMLTGVLTGVATQGCYFVYYQPEVPENLHKFSKNK